MLCGSADNAPPSVNRSRRSIELIGAACGRGGADPACAQAPARLSSAGLAARLKARGCDINWGPTLQTRGGGTAQAVSSLVARLAAEVARSVRDRNLACVIGGDHSIAVGTWSGVAAATEAPGAASGRAASADAPGLVWIDAHLDSHTPGTSPSGRLHGMPLAALLGAGDDELAGLGVKVLDPRYLCLVGARSFEVEEMRLLERLGVRIIGHAEIQKRGLAAALQDALSIARGSTGGFGISLDLDVLDPETAPGVATPVPNGLQPAELAQGLAGIVDDENLLAIEIAEYCPRRDRDGRTERVIESVLSSWLGATREDPHVVANAFDAV
jgi:arginase